MNAGDKVSFPFAKGTMEGVVVKLFEKTVVIKADFPRHKGKIVRRKLSDLQNPKKRDSKAKKRSKEKT